MEESVFFFEKQWFVKQWWFYVLFGIVVVFVLVYLILKYNHIDTKALLIGGGIPFLILITLLGSFHLTTRISKERVQISFFPFVFYNKDIAWTSVKSATVTRINAFREFGGAGVRYRGTLGLSFNGRDMGYIVSGNTGLQLELQDGSKIFIGTKKEAELEKVLREQGLLK